MDPVRKAVMRVGFETLYFSGAHRIARRFLAGAGAILLFHRVLPASPAPFQPNNTLEITPEFLDLVLTAVRAADLDIVSLDEAVERIQHPGGRRFVVLTFDDGYRDTLEFALPILERHNAPFTLYVPSAFADGTGEMWWMMLEEAIARNPVIEVEMDGDRRAFHCALPETKQAAFDVILAYLRSRPTWDSAMDVVRQIAFTYGVNGAEQCRVLCLGWDELGQLARHRLATIGAHTVSHPILAKLTARGALEEMDAGASRIGEMIGARPTHFSYPVGGPDAAAAREFAMAREVGFGTAVTTRPGVLHGEHAAFLTALPRLSIHGDFQRLRYVNVLLSGFASALMTGFRRVDAA